MDNNSARALLLSCFEAAIAAVDPEVAVARNLGPIDGRVVVLALGKGAPAMVRGAARGLRRESLEGIAVSNYVDEVPPGIDLLIGSHPIPTGASLEGGRALLDKARSLTAGDVALVLISGGGSALAEVPVAGLTIDDIAATNDVLIRSGADITAVNTVRRRLSLLKGGGLARAIAPARIITLVVSDVVGDHVEAIASGPTVSGGEAENEALRIVESLGVAGDLPAGVMAVIEDETKTAAEPVQQDLRIVAGGATAAHAAAAAAEAAGIPATVVDTRLVGDAAVTAGETLRRAGRGMSVFAGETTVDVTGDGVGGRNHEAALAAATVIDGRTDIWFLAGGTDGIDGMTDAAGAIVDGETVARARAAGLDPDDALDRNDSGTFFAALGEQIVTGPSGTNVGDIWLVLSG